MNKHLIDELVVEVVACAHKCNSETAWQAIDSIEYLYGMEI